MCNKNIHARLDWTNCLWVARWKILAKLVTNHLNICVWILWAMCCKYENPFRSNFLQWSTLLLPSLETVSNLIGHCSVQYNTVQYWAVKCHSAQSQFYGRSRQCGRLVGAPCSMGLGRNPLINGLIQHTFKINFLFVEKFPVIPFD